MAEAHTNTTSTVTGHIDGVSEDASNYEECEEFIYIGRRICDLNPPAAVTKKKTCCTSRRISSKGAILVIAICVAVDTGYYSTLNAVGAQIIPWGGAVGPFVKNLFGISLIGTAIPQLFYPLAGWIADARIGRYRVTKISLWLVFIGNCVLFFPFLFLQLIDKAVYVYYIFPVAYLAINAGLAGFRTNIIQFGMDQMVGASGSQLSAFIHWYWWSTYVGSETVSVILDCLFSDYLSLVVEVGVNVLFMGAALFCWYCLDKWLVKEPISSNPFKTVYNVLKFCSQHKTPIHRSSLTYWDDMPPSRLDLGKSKYGGPFSTEKVEDVKSFFTISLLLISVGGFLIVDDTYEDALAFEMNNPTLNQHYCSVHDIITTQTVIILLAVPLHEFVICPLYENYIPTSLKKIGIGTLVSIAAISSALIIDLYIHEGPDHTPKDRCINSESNNANVNSSTSAALIAVPITLDNIADLIVYISIFEFIFAQSPYSMRSMLVGTWYTIQGLYAMVPLIIEIILTYAYGKSEVIISCNSVYYVIIIIIGIIGFFLYSLVAKRYKKRLRDEHIDQHIIVENYYSSQPI